MVGAYGEGMRAVTFVDGAIEWRTHPDPVPGPGEVLVAVESAGINGADMLQRRGLYPAPAGVPADIPGMELAGRVVATGPGTVRFSEGDRVMAIVGGGGQAELAKVVESTLLPVPDGIGWSEAGGFPEVFSTAHDALLTQAHLAAGERVLVSGAAGGVGTAAVQLAHRTGATVVASVRSGRRRSEVASLGADEVIDPEAVGRHGPYDVSLELVGAPGVVAVLPLLSVGARVVVIGVGSGAMAGINLLELMGRRASIRGSTLRARPTEEKAEAARGLETDVIGALARGEVRVPVAAEYPMSEAEAAYARFSSGDKFGKVVLVAR